MVKTRSVQYQKPKMEFSKKILFVTAVVAGLTFIYAMWIQHLIIITDYHGDISITLTMLGIVGTEIGVGIAFYFNKAKAENIERERRKTLLMGITENNELEDENI